MVFPAAAAAIVEGETPAAFLTNMMSDDKLEEMVRFIATAEESDGGSGSSQQDAISDDQKMMFITIDSRFTEMKPVKRLPLSPVSIMSEHALR